MLVWGGFGVDGYTNDGGSYILSKTEWSRIPSTGAPEGREGHVAVWTGKEMLIWGGSNYSGLLQNGGLYNPSLNTWRDLTIPNQPEARTGATSVWIGKELLIWGGMGANGPLNSGSKLVFDENGSPIEWRSISEIGAPLGRVDHTAVHSKTQMIIWGGKENGAVLADGGLYDPTSDTWKPITTEGAPEARHSHNAVWTGSEMVILNGANSNALYSSGGAYNPATEQWRELKNSGNPPARRGALVGWTGKIFWFMVGRVAPIKPSVTFGKSNLNPSGISTGNHNEEKRTTIIYQLNSDVSRAFVGACTVAYPRAKTFFWLE